MRCTLCMGPMVQRRGAMRCTVCGAVADEVSGGHGTGHGAPGQAGGLARWLAGAVIATGLVGAGVYLAAPGLTLFGSSGAADAVKDAPAPVETELEGSPAEAPPAESPTLAWRAADLGERAQPAWARAMPSGGALVLARLGAAGEDAAPRLQAVLLDEQGEVRYRQMLSTAFGEVLGAQSDMGGEAIAAAGVLDGSLVVERAGADGAVWTRALGVWRGGADRMTLEFWDGAPVIAYARGDGQGVAALKLAEGGQTAWRREWPWRQVEAVKIARGEDGRALIAVAARRAEDDAAALYWEVLDAEGQTVRRGAQQWPEGARLEGLFAAPGGFYGVLAGGAEPVLALFDASGAQSDGWRLPALAERADLAGAASGSGFFIAATAPEGEAMRRGWLVSMTGEGMLAVGGSAPLEAETRLGPLALDPQGGLRLAAIGAEGALRPGMQLGWLKGAAAGLETAGGAGADWAQLERAAPWPELAALAEARAPGSAVEAAADEQSAASAPQPATEPGPALEDAETPLAAMDGIDGVDRTEQTDQAGGQVEPETLDAAEPAPTPPALRSRTSAVGGEELGPGAALAADPDDALAPAAEDAAAGDVGAEEVVALRFACRFACVSVADPEIAFPLAQTITLEQATGRAVLESFIASHPEEYCAPLRLEAARIIEATCLPE